MIIYNKYNHKQIPRHIQHKVVKPTRPTISKENKEFLKLIKLKVKPNV